ncbi:S41 family peptidase [Amycolatopsis ultiminotia]|uniref:Tricorn protease homolog n=1 Tax=Amycolatopsis ultiminotia TaxID=543629 RepID=A0ABP6W0P3_9PSEU
MTDSYLRFPHLHDDLVTFVAEDDVWLAPLTGGRAWRVSADRVPARRPRFSPDGTRIAWTSSRDGSPEVHVAPADGGPSTRLTYWADPTTDVLGWREDAKVVAKTAAGRPSNRHTWAHAVPATGGPAEQLAYGPVGDLAFGPHGAVLLNSVPISRDPAGRKRYRGGTAGKLWLDPSGTGEFTRVLAELDGNIDSPGWLGERIAFLSDHEGVGALYSAAPDGTDLRRHSSAERGVDFYARHAGGDGTRIVYESAGELWLLSEVDAEPRKLDIKLGGSAGDRRPYPIDAAGHLGVVAPDHTGRASAVEVRGTVHWLTHTDGPARALTVEPGVRARFPVVLGNSGNVAWITDADGEDAVQIAPSEGGAVGDPPRRIGTGELGRVLELVAAPDGIHLAVVSHDSRLLLIDTGSGELREVTRAAEGDPTGPAFSPDSRWLAWSHPGPDPLRRIRLAALSDLIPTDVTDLRFTDSDPVFTRDGKYLAFLSVRSFEPVYDVHVFEMSFPRGCRPYLVPLGADTPSPFDPQPAGRPPAEDRHGETGEHDAVASPTVVDTEGIADRLVAFPVGTAAYTHLQAAENALFWLVHPVFESTDEDRPETIVRPKPALERFDLTRLHVDQVEDGIDAAIVSGDGRRVVLRDGKDLCVVPASGKAGHDARDGSRVEVDLDRIQVTVDPAAEWRQGFDEAGRLMRDHFWRADMNGVDWEGELRRYRPLLDRIGTADDFRDLLWEVQGELGTSHAYVTAPDPESGRRPHGKLGADLYRDTDGHWRIGRILPGESSDPRARSPLRAAGIRVREGDAVLAVDGQPVPDHLGPAPLLAGTAGKPVELTIAPAQGGSPRRVVLTPLADETSLRYHAWIAGMREYVHEATDGRAGYLHVPDMVANGWAQLHRDLRLEVRYDALIVDVRENRGGHLSQLVVERLARTVGGWGVARDRWVVETYPKDAPRGPVVAIADEFSGSDGDIVTNAIKARGIAPVVGVRTWGGTIGIDRRYRLVDGTAVTQPRYAHWYQGPGWGIENHGVDPDVEVVRTPQDRAAGRDPQLDTAIRLALSALAERPAATPPELPPPGVR